MTHQELRLKLLHCIKHNTNDDEQASAGDEQRLGLSTRTLQTGEQLHQPGQNGHRPQKDSTDQSDAL